MIIEKQERRARNVALVGLLFQGLLLCLPFFFMWRYSGSEALRALTHLCVVGCWIWLALLIIYHQRALVQDEAFESEQLRRSKGGLGGERIFDLEGEELLLARRRLYWMYRWLLPIFTAILFLSLLLAAAFGGWPWSFTESFSSSGWPAVKQLENGLLMWFVGGAALLSFWLSRYAVGMARHAEWTMLRAGASYLMGITLAAVATTVVLAIMHFSKNTIVVPERVVAYVLRILLLVLAAEFALNFVLDLYRPRAAGEEPRPAFDSRFLGLFSEPGGIAGSIAEAINYQFGFDVSSTWFYQLLQRSVVPLLGFGAVTIFLASCLVFVDSSEQAVIEHFGRPVPAGESTDGRTVATLGPGLHLKWPWPIDVAHKVGTQQIHELKIGLSETTPEQDQKKEELILWTNKHSQEPHLNVLLATPEMARIMEREAASRPAGVPTTQPSAVVAGNAPTTRPSEDVSRAVPVSILRVAATIQYKVKDAWQWITEYEEPEKMLEAIANREIMRHCASADVMGLLGTDRGKIERAIWQSVQKSADDVRLGIDIEFFGLQGVHPPEKTADDFQKVISAENEKIASINSAHAEEYKRLTAAAGGVTQARELDHAIREMNRLDALSTATAEQRAAARERVDRWFFGRSAEGIDAIGGQAAVRVADARSRRWKLDNEAAAKAIAFEQEMATKNAAPSVYGMRLYLETLAESTAKARKYILAAEGKFDAPLFMIDLKDPLGAPLGAAVQEQKQQ